MGNIYGLNKGDMFDNGQSNIQIVDEDRLCYLVKSTSRNAFGIRTISKSLFKEWVDYFEKHPNASAHEAREYLSGKSNIDKHEYGYEATLRFMALMAIEKTSVINQTLPLQTIYYGTPGSGKSHKVKEMVEGVDDNFVFRTTFHPDSDYASFVGCYKPCTYLRLLPDKGLTENQLLQNFYDSKDENKYKGEIKARYFYEYLKNAADIKRLGLTSSSIADKLRNMGFDKTTYLEASLMTKVYDWLNEDGFHTESKISYEFCPQAFTKAYVKAWQNPGEPVYLIIEEINRGNCAQIFGDLFQLLDRKNGVSEYPIDADNDLKDYLEKELGVGHDGIANGKLRLPSNLNILATMNTSDQSLFPMDSAFKRRWSWQCVPIEYEEKKRDGSENKSYYFTINIDNDLYSWHDFLKKVNVKIKKTTLSEDKQMGNFFITNSIDERQFIDKVMFYLWNDICKDEYGANSFFRRYIDENNPESEFSFNDLFEENYKDILTGFMKYLSVEIIKTENNSEQ